MMENKESLFEDSSDLENEFKITEDE